MYALTDADVCRLVCRPVNVSGCWPGAGVAVSTGCASVIMFVLREHWSSAAGREGGEAGILKVNHLTYLVGPTVWVSLHISNPPSAHTPAQNRLRFGLPSLVGGRGQVFAAGNRHEYRRA